MVGRESISDVAKDPLDEAGRSSLAGLQVVCGIRKTPRGRKKNYKSFRNPDTYDLAGAWPLRDTPHRRCRRWRSCPEEGSFPFWTLRPPPLGKPSSSSLPPLGERLLSSPPRPHGMSPPRSHRTMSLITPGAGNSSEFPWPSSWPSSPAPRKAPGPAALSNGHPLGLRARSRAVNLPGHLLPSLSKVMGVLDPA